MRRIRTGLAVVAVVAMVSGATASGASREQAPPPPREARGFVDAGDFRARQDAYLTYATEELDPDSAVNVLAHAERARRDPSFAFDGRALPPDTFATSFDKLDRFADTSDFDLLNLVNLWQGYRDHLHPDLVAAIEQRILDFKYWYDEPTPDGLVDQKWYWSENHRIIFHTLEYLAGQAFPEATFSNDGRTGAEHRAHAETLIGEWLTEKARFGFSEWHSDVYYQEDVEALLTLVEWADDPAIVERSAMLLDLVLYDIALHLQRGNNGATHGRSYMKDKSTAVDQDVFGLAKLLFDDTTEPYRSRSDAGAAFLARAQVYRMPEVLRRVATSDARTVDRERMGVPLDPHAPLEADPLAPYGYDFDDPENVDFWWERGALTAWQVVPLTLATLDRHGLWESDFFQPFRPFADAAGGDPEAAKGLARSLAPMLAFGLLSEVNTYTYRAPDAMLSTAQDHRKGDLGAQYHAWQATLDEEAVVFTTHPTNEPEQGTRWPDSDGYWTGTGSMPRSAQQGTAAVHIYQPSYDSPDAGLLERFAYLPMTHAYFPQERFDEVVSEGGWTIGRRGDGYVALWSWRPTRWRDHDPAQVFTNGLTEPFDLVAEGGADNVWVVEVGDAERWGSFEAFRSALTGATPEVTDLGGRAGFDVAYDSPTEGSIDFGWEGPLGVDGHEIAIADYPRFDNPWSTTPFDSPLVEVRDGRYALTLDFAAGDRTVAGPAVPRTPRTPRRPR